MAQNEIRQTALELSNDVFEIGWKYVKHKRIASFFSAIFRPRLQKIITEEATEKELLDAMWSIKKKIDKTFSRMNNVEDVLKSRELNRTKENKMQNFVEHVVLKKDRSLIPNTDIIQNEKKAIEGLEDLGI